MEPVGAPEPALNVCIHEQEGLDETGSKAP